MVEGVKQAVVLAGGEGTRLRPLTNDRPKPMLPVLGRPCIEYVLRSLEEAGIGEIQVACGYRSDALVDSLRSFGGRAELRFAFEDRPAGTAGAVKLLEGSLEGTFVVASGDVLADVSISDLVRSHREKGAFVTMALTTVQRPEEFGIVGLDHDGRIERFKEKPPKEEIFSNMVNAGIYVLEREALDFIPPGKMFDFSKNLFPLLLGLGKPMFGALLKGMWKDIGRPSDLIEANIEMASRRGRFTPSEAIVPPAHLGDGVEMARGASVRRAVLGSGVVLGRGTEVTNSLLMDRCRLGDGCRIMGCAIGNDCYVGDSSTLIDCVLADGVNVPTGSDMEGERLEP